MKSTLALLRAGLPTRLALFAAIVVISAGAALLTGGDAQGSESRMVAIALLELGVLPVFAAMLGGALVHGEHAPWSWGFARPIGRGRWAAVALGLDAALLWAGAATITAMLGELPSNVQFQGLRMATMSMRAAGFEGAPGSVLLFIVYFAAALGAARGRSTLRGLPVALGYALALACAAAIVLWLDNAVARLFVVDTWPTPARAGLLGLDANEDLAAGADLLIDIAALATIVAGAHAHLLGRAWARLPARLSRREVVAVFALWTIATASCSWALRSRVWAIADAPVLARRGDAVLAASLPVLRNRHFVALVQIDCDDCFGRHAADPVGPSTPPTATFDDVVPGRYRLCEQLSAPEDHANVPARWQRCTEVDVAPGENRIDVDFSGSPMVPLIRNRQLRYDRDDPFARLLLLRDLATSIDDVFSDDPPRVRGAPILWDARRR